MLDSEMLHQWLDPHLVAPNQTWRCQWCGLVVREKFDGSCTARAAALLRCINAFKPPRQQAP